jgi:Mg2+-importing ATPase
VISAAGIVLVIRTRRPFFKSMPGKYLFWITMLIVGLTLALPYTPLAAWFEFKPLPGKFLLMLGGILILYVLAAELMKKIFYRWLT